MIPLAPCNAASTPLGGAASFGFRKLHRLIRERPNKQVPYVAHTDLERWPPGWVGLGLPRAQYRDLLAKREKGLSSLSSIHSNTATFWLSHLAAGAVDTAAVLAHLLLLIKLADERSVTFSSRYLLLFHARLRDRIKASEHFDLNVAISELDPNVFQRIVLESAGSTLSSRAAPPLDSAAASGDKPGKRAAVSYTHLTLPTNREV